MKKRKAILIVSFGTAYPDSLSKTIDAIGEKVVRTFPDFAVYKAFTSQIIINKLKKTHKMNIDNVAEAFERMAACGIEAVIIQSTNIINGREYEKMLNDIDKFRSSFSRIRIGKPLLNSADDYKKVIHAMMSDIKFDDDEVLVLMGHGADHHATSAYPALEYTFHLLGYDRVLVGVIEGFPDINNVMAKLKISNRKKIILMPFLLVAGGHVRRTMVGGADSWLTKLEDNGYEVRTVIKGLGEMEGIRNIFLEHIETVM